MKYNEIPSNPPFTQDGPDKTRPLNKYLKICGLFLYFPLICPRIICSLNGVAPKYKEIATQIILVNALGLGVVLNFLFLNFISTPACSTLYLPHP